MIVKNKIKTSIYVPFIKLDCEFQYKKFKDLNEFEAIILSYIHCLQEKNNVNDLFIKGFLKQFNLDEKWEDFIINKLEKFFNNNEIEVNHYNNWDFVMNGDIKLNKNIDEHIKNFKFKGLDSRNITKKVYLFYPIFPYVYNKKIIEENNFKAISDSKLIEIKKNILEFSKQDNYDDLVNDYAINSNINDALIKTKYSNNQIEFESHDCYLELEIKDNKLNLSSYEKDYFEIFKKFIEIDCSDLIIIPFLETLKEEKWNKFTTNRNSDLVQIDEYENKINRNNEFITNSKNTNSDLFVEDQVVFKLHKKEIEISINDFNIKKICLLSQTKYLNLEDYVIEEINNKNFWITKYITSLKHKTNLHNFFISNFDDLINEQNIRTELVNNYFKNNIKNHLIRKCFFLNSISNNDWEVLIKNNKKEFEQFIKKNYNELNDEFYKLDKLTNNKIMKLIELIDVDLEIILKWNFKYISEFKELDLKIKELEKTNNSYESLNEDFSSLKEKINEFIKKSNNKLVSLLKIDKIESNLKLKRNETKETLLKNRTKLLDVFVELLVFCGFPKEYKLDEFINRIENSNLKSKMHEIRHERNKSAHYDDKYNLQDKDIEKIIKLNKEIEEYINFINENKQKIKDNLKKE